MPHDFTQFDEFKKALGNKWKRVSGYDITIVDDLAFEGLKGLIYSAVLKELNVEEIIHILYLRAIKLYKNIKLPNSKPIPNTIHKGNLDRYLDGGF